MKYRYKCTACPETIEVEHPESGLHMQLLPTPFDSPSTQVPDGFVVTMHYDRGTHIAHAVCPNQEEVMGLPILPLMERSK